MLALGANSLLSGLFTSIATDVVGGIAGAVANELLPNNGESSQFANLINSTIAGDFEDAPDISNLTNLSDSERSDLINQLVSGLQSNEKIAASANEVLNNLTGSHVNGAKVEINQALKKEIITEETLSVIKEILSDQPSAGIAQNQNAVLEGNSASVANSSPNPLAKDGLEQALLAQQNQSTSGSIVRTAKNGEKDLRLLGEGNLKSMVDGTKNEIIKDFNAVTEKGLFAEVKSLDNNISRKESFTTTLPDGQINVAQNSEKQNILNGSIKSAKQAQKVANENFAYKVANITKKADEIEVKLDPESLGKLSIKLAFNQDGKTSFIVMAEKADTLELLKKDSASLEKILNDNGIEADSSSMSFNLKGGDQGQTPQEQREWNLFNNPVAFNIEDFLENGEFGVDQQGSSISNYTNLYSDNLVNIIA